MLDTVPAPSADQATRTAPECKIIVMCSTGYSWSPYLLLCAYVCVCVVIGPSAEEILSFLDKSKESHIKHCNAFAIRSNLRQKRIINLGQNQQLDSSLNVAAANDLFYQFLCSDPTPETLLAAAKVLSETPDTTNMNKRFAKEIEHFLH